MTRAALLAAGALLFAPATFAARPLTTEDAAVLDDKACQVESWIDRSRDATIGWLVPACNFGLGIEWQAGFSREWEGGARMPESYFQAKGLFKDMDKESPWAVGWVAGFTRHLDNATYRGWDNPYVLIPVSITLGDFTAHVQPGWARDRETSRDLAVWGVAMEHATTERLTLLGEVFGQNSEKPFLRAGFRWSAIKDHLEFDLTYVTRPGGTREERLVSLGLAWHSAPFLP